MSEYMAEALRLAKLAQGRTSPNPLVGAVIVKQGRIIGSGYHHRAGTPHAEVHALAEAGDAARDATVYVTLEPCAHFGRTPPCSQALIKAGVGKVIIAMQDPNPLVAGKGIEQLKSAGVTVEVGDMEKEARSLNEVFIKYITTRMPFVVFKTAMSLDGKIATVTRDSRWITGPETRRWVHNLRDRYDAILVGSGTVLTDDPELTTRIPQGKDAIRLLVDSRLSLPLSAKIIASSPTAPLWVATTTQASPTKIAVLEAKGVKFFIYDQARVPLKTFMSDLGRQGITSILLEGGSSLAGVMLADALIDKIHFCIAPKLIGGNDAPSPLGGKGFSSLVACPAVKNVEVCQIGSDFIFTGYPSPS